MIVARSGVEVEFRDLTKGICEGMWLKRLLGELRIETKELMHILCDNKSAISIAKHMKLDRHFIKEKVKEGILELTHTPTSPQVVDIFTKALPRVKFKDLISNLGIIDIHCPTRERE